MPPNTRASFTSSTAWEKLENDRNTPGSFSESSEKGGCVSEIIRQYRDRRCADVKLRMQSMRFGWHTLVWIHFWIRCATSLASKIYRRLGLS